MEKYDVWNYRDKALLGYDPTSGADITGLGVEALDGSIGKIDKKATPSARATSSSAPDRGSSARR